MSSALLPRPLVYAHRGGAALRPENTLAAFDHGLSLGADGLELDVHLSSDGVVVVHHDPTLERTTNGRGPIAAQTAAGLAAIDAAYWFRGGADGEFPFRGQGIGVPALRTVLERYAGIPLIIEMKGRNPELVRRIVDLVRGFGAVDNVALGSFHTRMLRVARRAEPRIRTGAARGETRWALYRCWVGWPLGRTAYREFQVPERSGRTTVVDRRFIAHAHRADLLVKVWTVNDRADIDRLLDWGVDGIISDWPDVAVEAVEARRSTPRV